MWVNMNIQEFNMTNYEKKLRKQMDDYLSLCTNDFERSNVIAICEREIEEKLKTYKNTSHADEL
jgi:hypothetical protein